MPRYLTQKLIHSNCKKALSAYSEQLAFLKQLIYILGIKMDRQCINTPVLMEGEIGIGSFQA
jgi:hypothetical protein